MLSWSVVDIRAIRCSPLLFSRSRVRPPPCTEGHRANGTRGCSIITKIGRYIRAGRSGGPWSVACVCQREREREREENGELTVERLQIDTGPLLFADRRRVIAKREGEGKRKKEKNVGHSCVEIQRPGRGFHQSLNRLSALRVHALYSVSNLNQTGWIWRRGFKIRVIWKRKGNFSRIFILMRFFLIEEFKFKFQNFNRQLIRKVQIAKAQISRFLVIS